VSRIVVSLQPGIIRDPDTELVIRFTSPLNAQNVQVTVKEMDTWHYRRDTMVEAADGRDDNIAIFNGTIERRRFRVGPNLRLPARADAPILRLRFHGSDTAYELPIPDSTLAEEGGELEIGVHVTGEVQVRRRTINREFTTRWPVFVRNYGTREAPQRPVITFVAGRDGFYNAAFRYWQRRADGVVRLASVQQILEYLGNQRNLVRAGEGRRWGEINIVTHANADQWMIRMFTNRRAGVNHIDVNKLNEHGNDARLVDPGADKIDADTRIVIRGCVIGQNQALLNRIHTLFGGRAKVYAPQYIQGYQYYQRGRTRQAREYFEEFFFIKRPGRRIPSLAELIRLFTEKYPAVGIDEAEWRRLLQGRRPRRSRHNSLRVFRFTMDYGEQVPPRGRAELLVQLERMWPGGHETYNTAVGDWYWTFRRQVRGPRGNRTYRILCLGAMRRVEVRRPLTDVNDALIVPNLYNENHYGRSPAPGWE